MSSRQSVLLTSGVLILVIIGMVMNFYTTSRANDTVSEVQRLILEGRQIGNVRGNLTLGAVSEAIKHQDDVQKNILGNLTHHRIVANETRDLLKDYIQSFNNTNEQGRSKAVDQIINETKKLFEQYQQPTFETTEKIVTNGKGHGRK